MSESSIEAMSAYESAGCTPQVKFAPPWPVSWFALYQYPNCEPMVGQMDGRTESDAYEPTISTGVLKNYEMHVAGGHKGEGIFMFSNFIEF